MPYERIVPTVVLGLVLGGCSSEESPPGPATSGCPTFDSAFEAIQSTIFERRGCTAAACHGSAAAGELDLRADVAWSNLVKPSPQVRLDTTDELADTPGSVSHAEARGAAIHLGPGLLQGSSDLPGCSGEQPSNASCLALLRVGFTLPSLSPATR